MTLPSLLTQMSFFYRKVANFWYMTCFDPNWIMIPWTTTTNFKKLNQNFGNLSKLFCKENDNYVCPIQFFLYVKPAP